MLIDSESNRLWSNLSEASALTKPLRGMRRWSTAHRCSCHSQRTQGRTGHGPHCCPCSDRGMPIRRAGRAYHRHLQRRHRARNFDFTLSGTDGQPPNPHAEQLNDNESVGKPGALRGAVHSLLESLAAGIPFHGNCHWSFVDNLEWIFGYARHFHLRSVGRDTVFHTPKQSAVKYARVRRAVWCWVGPSSLLLHDVTPHSEGIERKLHTHE